MSITFRGTYRDLGSFSASGAHPAVAGTVTITPAGGSATVETLDGSGKYEVVLPSFSGKVTVVEDIEGLDDPISKVYEVVDRTTTDTSKDLHIPSEPGDLPPGTYATPASVASAIAALSGTYVPTADFAALEADVSPLLPLELVNDLTSVSPLVLTAGDPVVPSTAFTQADVGKQVILTGAVLRLTAADGAMTSGSKRIDSTLGAFTKAHQGDSIAVPGAGAAGATLSTTIAYVESATVAYTATAASTTVAGATYVVSRALATTIASVSAGGAPTLANAPTNNSTNAVLNYGTNASPAIAAAVTAAGDGGRVVLPAGAFMLDHASANPLPVNVGCILEGQGETSPTRTGGTRLVYGGTGTGVWLNSNGTNITNTTLRNLSLDGLNCGAIGLAFGSTTGGNKSAVATVANVKVERFRTANVRFISAAIVELYKVRSQTATGADGFLFDAVTGSGFNTSITLNQCFATACQRGWVFKDARVVRTIRCESYANQEEGVLVEHAASSTFHNRVLTFDEFRNENNCVAAGVTGTGRAHFKCDTLGTGTSQANDRINLIRPLLSGAIAGDRDLSVRGGYYLLDHVSWGATSGGFGAIAPAVGSSFTTIEEHTNDALIPNAQMPNGGGTQLWTFGTGVKYSCIRTTSVPSVEQWVANGGVAGRRNFTVVASADESRNNTEVLTDDVTLQAWLGANLTYRFRLVLFLVGVTAADANFAVVTPSGTPTYGVHGLQVNATSTITTVDFQAVSGSGTPFPSDVGTAGSAMVMVTIEGSVTTTTEGLLKLQWAQGTATVANVTRKAQSSLEVAVTG